MEEDKQKSSAGKKYDQECDLVSSDEDKSGFHCHTLSEGSDTSPEQDGNASKNVQCIPTPINGFLFPGLPASPPRFVTLDQIMKAANGVSNMILAHEIAVDKDFKLDKVAPKSNLEKQVKDIVHKAFWDVLQKQLNEDPPNYTQAMILLAEVKEGLLSILLPHHTRIKSEINEGLDIDLIHQQVENGTLDFQYYSQYIISIMSRLCAPVRDKRIEELTSLTDIVSLYKNILEILDLMKLDMANFTIQQFRPHIQQHSVEYERKKFQEFLDTQAALASPVDGLHYTRHWLQRAYEKLFKLSETMDASPLSENGPSYTFVLTKAYLELLEWDNDEMFPETLLLDQIRFLTLRDQLIVITLVASILLVTYTTVGESIQGISEFKESLKDHINVLLEGAVKCSQDDLQMKMENVGIQVVKEVNECLQKHGYSTLSQAKETAILGQIKDVASPEHSVRKLIKTRVLAFVEHVVSSSAAGPIKIPPGLSSFRKELANMTGQFLRLVDHNRSVFGDYYADIVTNLKHHRENKEQHSKDTLDPVKLLS